MTPPTKKYPDYTTVKSTLALSEFLRQSHKRAGWNKAVKLLAVAVVSVVSVLVIWFFWPQISAVLTQFMTWRNGVNVKVGP